MKRDDANDPVEGSGATKRPRQALDAAIDGAIREMLDVEPRADLRAHVVARIDGGVVAPVWRSRPAVAIAAVLIAIVVLPFLIHARHVAVPQQAPTLSARNRPAPAPSAEQSGRSMPNALPHDRVQAGQPDRSPASRSRPQASGLPVLAANVESPDERVAPLDPITPIHVAAVSPSDIAPPPIAIEPLAPIVQVQIAPLTPPDGRH